MLIHEAYGVTKTSQLEEVAVSLMVPDPPAVVNVAPGAASV
jgi:hypothetical protein